MMEPAGPGAATINTMWWVLLAVLTAVFVVVMAALGYALFRRRPPVDADVSEGDGAERRRAAAVVWAGAGVPAVILAGIFAYTMTTLDAIGPSATDGDLTIAVTGKQFWWDVTYHLPGGDTVRTANEIHVPVGRRVTLLLESDNVIHSLWIPRLHGKTDMIPGRTTEMWLQADEPGVYRGQCAEYCGVQHAWMALELVAEPDSAFRAWMARQRRPAAPVAPAADPAADSMDPAGPAVTDSMREAGSARNARIRRGREVFMDPEHRCAECHTIRGESVREGSPGPRPTDGPDLTHVAGRRRLAGGLLETNRGNLAGWLANPQVLKPGNLMPRIPLEPDELTALVDYLMSLR
jgi:cytochrome c oxidase subunit 2